MENKSLLLKSVYRLSAWVSAMYRFWMSVSSLVLNDKRYVTATFLMKPVREILGHQSDELYNF
jgi:hypothetical protein